MTTQQAYEQALATPAGSPAHVDAMITLMGRYRLQNRIPRGMPIKKEDVLAWFSQQQIIFAPPKRGMAGLI